MSSYAHAYFESQRQLAQASRELEREKENAESFRAFISETGQTVAYLLWWGKKEGFPEAHLDTIARAYENQPPPPPK